MENAVPEGRESNTRDVMLKRLVAAHNVYFELKKNLEEGLKFYKDIMQMLYKFHNQVIVR